MMKFLTCLALFFSGSISNASGIQIAEMSQIECGSLQGPVNRSQAYPIHVCKVRVPSLEVNGTAGINDFYELILSNGTREVWQPVDVTNGRIMCVVAPCPVAIRNYTLALIGYSNVVDGNVQLILDSSKKRMKAGAQVIEDGKLQKLFFIIGKNTFEAPELVNIEE